MKKTLVMLFLALVMVLGLTLGIIPEAKAATVNGTQIDLKYDDRKDLEDLLGTTVTSVTITNQTVTSKDVDGTADEAVLVYENGTLYAVGTGTATLTVNGKAYTVTVSPATISVFLITGHSVGYGQYGAAGQSVAIEPGQAYSSWRRESLTSAEGGLGYGSNKQAGGTNEYAIDAFDDGQYGTRGVGSALAYNWNKLTGEKVWVMNLAVPGSCINEWLPGVPGWHYESDPTKYEHYAYKYEATIKHFGYLTTILSNEIKAGHYELGHMSMIYFSGANFGNAHYTDWTYDSLKQDYATFWDGLKKDLAKDINGDGKTDTLESLGIVPLWSKSDQTYSYDKLLNYYMAASAEYPDVYIASECYRAWAKGELATFPAINYATQGTAVNVPTSISYTESTPYSVFCTEDNTHLSQVTYNAVGLDIAANANKWYTDTTNTKTVEFRYKNVSAVAGTLNVNNGVNSEIMTPVVPAGTHGNVVLKTTGNVEVKWPMYVRGTAVGSGTVTATVDGTTCDTISVTVADAHTHCACGGKASGMKNHTCSSLNYQAWGTTDAEKKSLPTAAGNYYLVSDITLSSVWTNAASTKVNICLNGHNITSTKRMVNVKGTLSITDCGKEADWGTMSTTQNDLYGGIFYIYENATLNLFGGIYDGTKATISQGAIAVVGNSAAATMNVYGGTLKGGAVVAGKKTDGSAVAARGGAIYMIASSTVNIYGGTITGGSSAGNGGNIYVATGKLYVYGGTITGGSATGHGGNIHGDKGVTIAISGGTISGGTVPSGKQGGNINIGAATLTISGGTVSDGTSGRYGGNICATPGGKITVSGSAIIKDGTATGTSGTGGNFFLGANDTTNAELTITGGTISGGSAMKGGNLYIDGKLTMSGGTVKDGTTPIDNVEAFGGNICGGTRSTGGIINISGGTVSGGKSYQGGNIACRSNATLSGGTISGGRAYKQGGNIYMTNTASRTLTITGTVTIKDGFARYKDTGTDTTDYPADGDDNNTKGGNLYIHGEGTTLGHVVISGGTLSGGTANLGGSIYCGGTMQISGGTITGGRTRGSSAVGGNIYQASMASGGKPTSVITMTGGTIKDGYANAQGGNMQTHGIFNMTGGTFSKGSATNGGNIRIFRPGHFTLDGGTITGGTCRNLSSNGSTGGNTIQLAGHNPTTTYSEYATLTIKSGTITGGTGNAVNGGTIHLTQYSVVNMEGGTINGGTAIDRDWEGVHYPGRGGVFCMYATTYTSGTTTTDRPAVLNISGGTINGGTAKSYGGIIAATASAGSVEINISGGTFNGGKAIKGGFLWTEDDCDINITGGTITGCEASQDGGLFWLGGGAKMNISGGTIDGGKATGVGDGICIVDATVTVSGDANFTGETTNIYVDNTTTKAKLIIDNPTDSLISVDAADKTAAFATSETNCAAKLYAADENYATIWKDGKCYFEAAGANRTIAVCEGGAIIAKYETFAEAAAAAMDSNSYVELLADTESDFNVTGTLYVHLNGFDLSGITVSGTLYGMDKTSDGYTDADLGTLTCTVAKGGKVAACKTTTEMYGSVKRYMPIPNADGSYSFHRFYMGITKVTLRPATAGIGYKATFAGSDTVKNYIDSYGYSMWIKEDNKLTGTKDNESFVSMGEVTLRIDKFLKPGQDEQNAVRAETPVYGSVFVKLGNGETLESAAYVCTFREIMEAVNNNYSSFTDSQKTALADLYNQYPGLMENWSVSNFHHGPDSGWTAVNAAGFKALLTSNEFRSDVKVYLTEDVELTSLTRVMGGVEVSICLNGHTIHSTARVFNVYGTLNIYDCCGQTDHPGKIYSEYASYGPVMYTYRGSIVNLYGGELVGNKTTPGGGVVVIGNDASDYSARTEDAVFNMYGGVIRDGKSSGSGGNIITFHGGTFNMYDGLISGGSAAANGGNICATSGDSDPGNFYVNIYGGTITGGSANNGGNIYVNNKTYLNVEGGTISHGSAITDGGNIYANVSATVSGGTITGGSASGNGGNIYALTTEMTVSGGTISNGTAKNGGNIYSSANISQITGGTVTGGEALITEAFDTTYVTGGLGGNIYLAPSSKATELSITGGTITGGKATDGGNIYILPTSSAVTVNISDVTLSGGEAYHDGGNLAFLNMGTVNLNNVTFKDGVSGNDGANIYLFRDMNRANTSLKFPTMNINGGKIVGGKAGDKGSGLYVQEGILTLTGNVQLIDNEGSNLYLDAAQTVELKDLAETAKIGISMNIAGTVTDDVAYIGNLSSDNAALAVENVGGTVKLTGGLKANVPTLTGYSVGWYRGDITPQWEVPLDGMGNNYGRMAKWEIKNNLQAGVTVIADKTGIENAIVLICVDTLFIQKELSGNLTAAISDATGIPANRIFLSASHTHCGVDHDGIYEGAREYLEVFYHDMTEYVVRAVEDLKPATIQVGSIDVIDAEGDSLNMARRYIGDDGNAYSSVDSASYPAPSGALRESGSDTEMQLIRFVREGGKDIVLSNYQTHPSGYSSGTNGYVSAEHWKIFREKVEADNEDTICTFFLGASGNVGFNTTAATTTFEDPNGTVHNASNWTGRGNAIAGFATYLLNNGMTTVQPGALKVVNYTFETQDAYRTSNPSNSKSTYGNIDLDLNAVCIGGNIAFVTTPYEPFHENGSQIKAYAESIGFETCFVLTNSMGENKYIGSYNSFENDETDGEYTSFGVRTCRFVKGTAEALMDCHADMLAQLAGVTAMDTIYETYTVKVVDANGNAVQNVMVQLIGGNDARNCTNASGEIEYWLYGGIEYAIKLVKVPSGYKLTNTSYKFNSNNELTIVLEKA